MGVCHERHWTLRGVRVLLEVSFSGLQKWGMSFSDPLFDISGAPGDTSAVSVDSSGTDASSEYPLSFQKDPPFSESSGSGDNEHNLSLQFCV